jgi:octaprenyl-diphosphate synthase
MMMWLMIVTVAEVFSINALWKNKIAVLVGDYLLSKGLLLSIDHGDFDLLRILSLCAK